MFYIPKFRHKDANLEVGKLGEIKKASGQKKCRKTARNSKSRRIILISERKWSNDNNTYTELAAPAYVDCADGLGFFFLGECPALDNGCAGAQYHNSPR